MTWLAQRTIWRILMRKTNGPRQNNRTASPQTTIPPQRADSDGDVRPETPKMFNILLALESARGLLRVRQVAALLGRSSCSVHRMAEKRQIPSLLIGGSRCFDPSVLALWLSKKEPTLAVAARRFRAARCAISASQAVDELVSPRFLITGLITAQKTQCAHSHKWTQISSNFTRLHSTRPE